MTEKSICVAPFPDKETRKAASSPVKASLGFLLTDETKGVVGFRFDYTEISSNSMWEDKLVRDVQSTLEFHPDLAQRNVIVLRVALSKLYPKDTRLVLSHLRTATQNLDESTKSKIGCILSSEPFHLEAASDEARACFGTNVPVAYVKGCDVDNGEVRRITSEDARECFESIRKSGNAVETYSMTTVFLCPDGPSARRRQSPRPAC